MTLDYGNHGIFLIMGMQGYISPTVVVVEKDLGGWKRQHEAELKVAPA